MKSLVKFLIKDKDFIQWVCGMSKSCAGGDIVTLGQVQYAVDHPFKGGQSQFIADGETIVFDIVHNLGAIPEFFTLTTTQPISSNILDRNITYPDLNTLRITFTFPPNIGEDANYIWVVYK